MTLCIGSLTRPLIPGDVTEILDGCIEKGILEWFGRNSDDTPIIHSSLLAWLIAFTAVKVSTSPKRQSTHIVHWTLGIDASSQVAGIMVMSSWKLVEARQRKVVLWHWSQANGYPAVQGWAVGCLSGQLSHQTTCGCPEGHTGALELYPRSTLFYIASPKYTGNIESVHETPKKSRCLLAVVLCPLIDGRVRLHAVACVHVFKSFDVVSSQFASGRCWLAVSRSVYRLCGS